MTSGNYLNSSHPVGTQTDAAKHMARKNLFCKPACSLPYQRSQMAGQQTVDLLTTNFARITCGYVQTNTRPLDIHVSILQLYADCLDPLIKKTNAHNMAIISAWQLISNLRALLDASEKPERNNPWQNVSLELKMLISSEENFPQSGETPQIQGIMKFSGKKQCGSKKALQRQVGFLNYYQI